MKWLVMGLGASLLALAVGAYALTAGGGRQAPSVVVTTTSSAIDAPLSAATGKATQTLSTAKKAVRRSTKPAPSPKCQTDGGENSDPTGDDRSQSKASCGSGNASGNSGDNQAGDSGSDQGGDNQAGDGKGGGP
jgi:hypothetical protein